MNSIDVVNVACNGGNLAGSTQLTPQILHSAAFSSLLSQQYQLHLQIIETLESEITLPVEHALPRLFARLHLASGKLLSEARCPFLVVGGDHSCAIGTWSGVLDRVSAAKDFGLIWLDAHLDAHTFQTSPSGNLHGMPLAALLGAADARLQAYYPGRHYLRPENLLIIGVRSYEAEERALLDRLGVRWIAARQLLRAKNVPALISTFFEELRIRCVQIGISVDLDFLDPQAAPGVAKPVKGGPSAQTLFEILQYLKQQPECVGLEIAEYSPSSDQGEKTRQVVVDVIGHFFG